MAAINPVPAGLHTLTPQLVVRGAAEAIETYKRVFGAEELSRAMHPSGKLVWHSAVRVGDATFFINDEMPEMPGTSTANLWLYSERADELFKRAKEAGFTVVFPMADQFWGDRTGTLKDRWGNQWTVARRIKEMTPEEMKRAGEAFATTGR